MSAYEKLILNPVEFTPELPERDLSALGIAIGEAGPDYGESSVQVERIKRAIGEGATSTHWPSVEASVPLIVSSDPAVSQAQAFQPIEAFVAEVQRRNRGWIRRGFADAAGFSGSVGCPVDAAAITTPKGLGRIDEITLKLSRYPFWFATVEILAGEAKGSGVRDLQIELAELLGTVPGLIRVVVTNEGSEDWRGCLLSIECDDLGEGETALPKYEAKDLTLKGGAEVATISGAEVVKCPLLSQGWMTVLSSEISGVGHMTHVGPRRMAFRVEDPSEETDAQRYAEWVAAGSEGEQPTPLQVQWKLEWRALGSANWIQTREGSTPLIAVSPVVGDYQLIDLGECRPEWAVTGGQRWEWRLQVRMPSILSVQPLIRDVYPASTEQWMRVADTSDTPVDGEPMKRPAAAADNEGIGTEAWSSPENILLEDNVVAKVALTEGQTSHYLTATNFGFAIPLAADILGIKVLIRRSGQFVKDNRVRIIKGGSIKSAADRAKSDLWNFGYFTQTYGSASDLWGQPWAASDVNADDFGIALSVVGVLPESSAEVDSARIAVAYADSADEARICFASRSIEFTDSGIRRQQVTDDAWGKLVPEGFLPYAPPAGQDDQPMRVLLVPSAGDFATRPDSSPADLKAQVLYRPACLFAREAG